MLNGDLAECPINTVYFSNIFHLKPLGN